MSKQNSINQLKQQQHLLQIGIFTLVTVVVWIGLSLFRSQSKTQVDTTLQKLALPLTPSIDAEVIDRLEQKKLFTEAELSGFPIYKFLDTKSGTEQRVVTIDYVDDSAASLLAAPSSSPSAFPSPSPAASPSATPSPSPSPSLSPAADATPSTALQ